MYEIIISRSAFRKKKKLKISRAYIRYAVYRSLEAHGNEPGRTPLHMSSIENVIGGTMGLLLRSSGKVIVGIFLLKLITSGKKKEEEKGMGL